MIRSKDYHEYTDYDLEPGGLRKLDYIVERVRKFLKESPTKIKILDVGCGNGNISLPLAFLGYQVIGLDAYPEAILELNKKNNFDNLEGVNKTFENYYPDSKFDVIIMSEFLEHTKDPKAVLKKAKRMLLKKDGLLILTVPNGMSLEESIRRVTGSTAGLRAFKKKVKSRIKDQEVQSSAGSPHLQFWSLFSLRSLILSAGFKIADIKSAAFLFKETYYILGRFIMRRGSWLFHWFDKVDSSLAKVTPPILASGWIITTEKHE
ncbi:MAG: hypothetical protein COT24_02015 [Candidatus Kerfeldbacteria bacterium CG08_land_8_20_14_0_20_40_16]|uniref:Methyltransferase type 11 domain-containing protein n=1 Tax=Candidatus Kerfeldbacteria bacterium CG08_land_8_20_14_0_20_40_16 TaxID=2014244 RepID=A0A2H0YW80_9BACT|nr:MAG: hypothetical protein COT24_02015 [Candidatus Kerfeldbacteria bacterium CG08_land_8_20_14_0_20_40_16]